MATVTILLSAYRPKPEYFREQLASLNSQTYEDLELIIRNDDPEGKLDREMIGREITRFPVRVIEGDRNLGYTSAFGELIRIAEGDYISLCDQDDIWEKDKIRLCMEAIRENHAVAAVCDRALMDGDGKVFCPSVRAARKEKFFTWHTGEDITARAAFISYCTGMTLIAERKAAQRCLPFTERLPHDQQLAFLLSGDGVIVNVEEPLVRHRRYGTNSSGTLAGVQTKQDYYHSRCNPVKDLLEKYHALYPDDKRIETMRACCEARMKGDVFGLIKYRKIIPDLYIYEIGLALCPEFVFRMLRSHLAEGK